MYDDETEKLNGINDQKNNDVFPKAEGEKIVNEELDISQKQLSDDDKAKDEEPKHRKMSIYAEYATPIYPPITTVVVSKNENAEQSDKHMPEEVINATENAKCEEKPNEPVRDTYFTETVKKKTCKKDSSFKKFIAACLVISLFGGTGIGASYAVIQNTVFNPNKATDGASADLNAGKPETKATASAQPVSSTSGTMTAVDVIDAVYPSVVNINMQVSGTTNYYGFSVPYEGSGSGSGVIFDMDDENVYIVTNNHVVESATGISVSVTGAESISATVVGTDASSDLAVIKALKSDFKAAGIDNIVAAKFGDSDSLKVGQSVLAIGNALGEGKSATGGMISMLNKNIDIGGINLEVLQTSAAINPGNSGGALVNYEGEIIGINTAKTSTSVAEAMGYAIPSNKVKEIMENLLVNGTTPQPYLGIMGSDITDDIADMYKLPVGVLVRQVLAGGGADMAGLKEGDVIISFAGKSVMNMESLISTLKEQEVGTTVEMGIIRDAKTSMTLNVKILDSNNIQ
ncbi:MAG: trypsin-like peptidase domain-containing protein [Lachnospiraceae bacterium]|nr:trypsin-like peptidase domain-containing protein [Lachnospiraceae bacterium]